MRDLDVKGLTGRTLAEGHISDAGRDKTLYKPELGAASPRRAVYRASAGEGTREREKGREGEMGEKRAAAPREREREGLCAHCYYYIVYTRTIIICGRTRYQPSHEVQSPVNKPLSCPLASLLSRRIALHRIARRRCIPVSIYSHSSQ